VTFLSRLSGRGFVAILKLFGGMRVELRTIVPSAMPVGA
jgi:hypothetical protein